MLFPEVTLEQRGTPEAQAHKVQPVHKDRRVLRVTPEQLVRRVRTAQRATLAHRDLKEPLESRVTPVHRVPPEPRALRALRVTPGPLELKVPPEKRVQLVPRAQGEPQELPQQLPSAL